MSTVDFVKDTGDGENGIPICKILVGNNLSKIILLKLKKYYLQWREHDKCRKCILFKDGVLRKDHNQENMLLLFVLLRKRKISCEKN